MHAPWSAGSSRSGRGSHFPDLGRVVPEFDDPALRERFFYSYRVIYKVEPHRVLIVAVIHGRRLIEPISDRFG